MKAVLQFGAFGLDARSGELYKGASRIRLQQHPLTILLLLIDEGGMVTREQIRERLWPNGTVVDWDRSINSAVNKLRAALSDTAAEPRYIETIGRRGYRLIPPVLRVQNGESSKRGEGALPPVPLASQLIGSKISHHRVLELIGAGGMGIVFKAVDLDLDRNVALKLLADDAAGEASALQRFEREAKAASALDHPNICMVYEFARDGDLRFLVMQLLQDGMILRDRIAAEGALPPVEALSITRQVLNALGAAHRHGMIHRDIKPANVFVSHTGIVKVLDFGVAKLFRSDDQDTEGKRDEAPVHSSVVTGIGAAVGTARYMSPEQVNGDPVDERTDLFSTGLLLQEMLTGEHRATEAPENAFLSGVLRKALAADPAQRFSSADAFQDALLAAERHVKRPAGRKSLGAQLAIGGAAVTAITLAAMGVGFFRVRSRTVAAPQPPRNITSVVSLQGLKQNVVVSPDGRQVAFSCDLEDHGPMNVYTKSLDSDAPIRLTNGGSDVSPAWSPDSRSIAFLRRSAGLAAVYVTPSRGGSERKLAEFRSNALPWEHLVDWSPDGRHLVVAETGNGRSRLKLLRSDTGQQDGEIIFPERAFLSSPRFSPDGQSIAALGGPMFLTSDVWVMDTRGGARRQVTHEGVFLQSLAWTPDGKGIIFASKRLGPFSLWWTAVSGGHPVVYFQSGVASVNPSFSRDGKRMAFSRTSWDTNIWRVAGPANPDRSPPVRITDSTRLDGEPDVSSDGRELAFTSDRSGGFEVWRSHADGSMAIRLTHFGGPELTGPKWSPDGKWIAFRVWKQDKAHAFVVPSAGGEPRELVFGGVPVDWSRDGRLLYMSSPNAGSQTIQAVPLAGGEATTVLKGVTGRFFETPDGFVYQKGDSIWCKRPNSGTEFMLVPHVGSTLWAPSGNGICYSRQEGARHLVTCVNAAGKATQLADLGSWPRVYGPQGFAASPDGRWLYYERVDQVNSEIIVASTGP